MFSATTAQCTYTQQYPRINAEFKINVIGTDEREKGLKGKDEKFVFLS